VSLSLVIAAVLFAAFLHALWNSLVKGHSDRFVMMLAIAVVQTSIALAMLPFVGPLAPEAWPWLLAAAIPHTTYKVFLARAYDSGDLSRIYPISRGLSLILVSILSIFVLGEILGPLGYGGIVAIALGVFLLSARQSGGVAGMSTQSLLLCLGAAGSVALYTVLDGAGVRASGNVAAFAAWLFIADGLGMIGFALLSRGRQPFLALRKVGMAGLLAGCTAFVCYWIAIWALAHAPAALVAALRETSVLFALLLARLRLGEIIGVQRWLAGAAVLGGIVCLRFA